jgi:hypothetical protein
VSATDTELAVLCALRGVYHSTGHATIGAVTRVAGLHKSTVHATLERLRCLGLASWEDGKQATLRPTYPVPPPPPRPASWSGVQELCRYWDSHANQGLDR